MTDFIFLVIKKGPDAEGAPFPHPFVVFPCSDPTEKKDSSGPFLNVIRSIFFKLIERIENKNPPHLPLPHFITIKGKNSHSP